MSLQRIVARRAFSLRPRLYSTAGPVIQPPVRTHKLRNSFWILTGTIVSVYSAGIYLSQQDKKYREVVVNTLPLGQEVLSQYETLIDCYQNDNLSWDHIKSYVMGKTIGIPITRHVPSNKNQATINEDVTEIVEPIKLSTISMDTSNDPNLGLVIENLNEIINAINNSDIVINNKMEKKSIDDSMQTLLKTIQSWNNAFITHIEDHINEGTRDRIIELDNKFNELVAQKEREIENKYNLQFRNFKEDLEEKAAQTLAVGLRANEAKLTAKKENEIALLSITQVDEFNKIVTDKVEAERNGKLQNLLELDERVNKFNETIEAVDNLVVRNTVINKLNSILKTIQDEVTSFNTSCVDLNKQINQLKLMASVLPSKPGKKNCKCCSKGSCKSMGEKKNNTEPHKVCKCSMKKDPSLLDITLNELDDITKETPILSNEQLYNRWSLLGQDFKVSSLLTPNAGFFSHLMAKIFSLFLFTKIGNQPQVTTKISKEDEERDNNLAIVYSRIQNNIKLSKLEDAVLDAVQLDGWSRALCEDWIENARRKLEVETMLQLLNNEIKTL